MKWEFENRKKILKKFIRSQNNQQIHVMWNEEIYFHYFMNKSLFSQFIYNFLALFLCETNVLNIFHVVDFFQIVIPLTLWGRHLKCVDKKSEKIHG